MKCDLCGTPSEFDAGFIKQRRSFSSRARTICPACWVKRNNTRGSRFLLAIPILALCGYALDRFAPEVFLGEVLLTFSIIGIFVVLAIIPHELGHATAAWALGWRVYQIIIGVGKPAWTGRWAGTLLDLRSIPVTGATFMAPKDTRWFRLKFFLAIFAGPAVNAAMACAVIVVFQGSLRHFDLDALPRAARLFLWANASVVFVNLWPHKPKTGFAMPSDGARLLQLLSFRKQSLEEVQAMRFAFEATICREQSDFAGARSWCDKGLALYPENFHLLNLSGINYLDEQNYPQARAVFMTLLEKEDRSSSARSILLNNLAYVDALSENPAWLSEADAYSKDAYTMLPWMPAAVGTRGTVLVALGRYREGIELLKKSLEDANTPRSKAENACHLAIALTQTGERNDALQYLLLARDLDPKCPLLPRAERAAVMEPANPAQAES